VHPHTKFQQNPTIRGRVIIGEPTARRCFRSKWTELHKIWPEHFNTIGQCAAEVSTIQSIFTARFSGRGQFWTVYYSVTQCWGSKPMTNLVLPTHLLDFRCYYISKSELLKLNWGSKIEAKFRTFHPENVGL